MDIANSFKQLKAYARIEGAILGVIWVASFVFLVYMPQSLWGNLIILSTPFYAGWRIKNFRDKIRGGFISFKSRHSSFGLIRFSMPHWSLLLVCLFISNGSIVVPLWISLTRQFKLQFLPTSNWEWTLASCKKAWNWLEKWVQ